MLFAIKRASRRLSNSALPLWLRNGDIAAETGLPPIKGDGPTCLLNQTVHHAASKTLPRRRLNQRPATLQPADREFAIVRLRPGHLYTASRDGEGTVLGGIRRQLMHRRRYCLSDCRFQYDRGPFDQ